MRIACFALAVLAAAAPAQAGKDDAKKDYVKRETRSETVRATLAAFGLPNLEGAWHYAGPFPLPSEDAFDKPNPPEAGIDLKAAYPVEGGTTAGWRPVPEVRAGQG